MFRIATAVFLALITFASIGCEERPTAMGAAGGKIAIVDAERVGEAMGWQAEIDARGQALQRELQDRMARLERQLQAQVQEARTKAGPLPNPEQSEQLRQVGAQAQARFTQEGQQAQAEFQQTMQQVTAQFFAQMSPAAQAVAGRKGASAVFFKQPHILVVDQGVDITDEVIAELQKSSPAASGGAGAGTGTSPMGSIDPLGSPGAGQPLPPATAPAATQPR